MDIPVSVIRKLQEALAELDEALSPYKPEFLARMYRARASNLEGKGKRLSEIKQHFQQKS